MKNQNFTSFAYTDSVKEAQEQYGSRRASQRMESSGDRFILTSEEVEFTQ